MKKSGVLSLLLIVVMIVALLAACSSGQNAGGGSDGSASAPRETGSGEPSAAADETARDLEPYEITMAMPVFGAIPADMDEVAAEISKIAKAKINATVNILPISIGAWQQQMNLMMSGSEKLDLAFVFGQGYGSQVASGQLLQLDELLAKYGQGIVNAVGPDFLEAAAIEGKIYGVPTLKDYAFNSGFIMRKDLAEKYGIDMSSIKTLDDVEKVLQTIKDNEPGMTPLAAGLQTPLHGYVTYDDLGDGYGVLPGFDNGLQVVNYYETDEYADFVKRMRRWFQAGYISKDAATSQVHVAEQVKAGKAAGYLALMKPGFEQQEARITGTEMVSAVLTPAYSTTLKITTALWTIAHHSENPERAMMFLNLMYTDKDIVNLLLWGIEGKHYVKVSDNVIDYPPGVDAKNVGYVTPGNWIIGNAFLGYTFVNEDPDLWVKMRQFNEQAIKSKALGFAYNPEPVKNELTALQNVMDQYMKVLETGTVDPDEKLPEFISKLKAAGIDKVIAEKQRQLDEWAANK